MKKENKNHKLYIPIFKELLALENLAGLLKGNWNNGIEDLNSLIDGIEQLKTNVFTVANKLINIKKDDENLEVK